MAEVGRPTKYKPEYAEQAYKLCLLGATDREMADFFEVSEQTLNAWKSGYPEFLESIRVGKAFADATVAEKLYKRATGYVIKETVTASFQGMITDAREIEKHYPPDVTAIQFWLKNRRPKDWRDKQVQEHEGSGVMTIQFVSPDYKES